MSHKNRICPIYGSSAKHFRPEGADKMQIKPCMSYIYGFCTTGSVFTVQPKTKCTKTVHNEIYGSSTKHFRPCGDVRN